MKKYLFFTMSLIFYVSAHAQVTQINSNNSLHGVSVLNNTLAIFESDIDASIWVSDGSAPGTFQLSDTIQIIGTGTVLNGKFIFHGRSPNCGDEIFITDGTKLGTKLVKDINPGVANSQPSSTLMAAMNGYVYFAAVTPAEGCELWKTDGTAVNTNMVKDIYPGAASGIDSSHFFIGAAGNTILFSATTAAAGNELWTTNGTDPGTSLLKDIVTVGANSSYPRYFYPFKNMALFVVNSADGTKGEIWRTDGTNAGTILIKDNLVPAFSLSNLVVIFHLFKDRAYFIIDDGVHSGDALYSTDGVDATASHTGFLKDMGSATFSGSVVLGDAFNLPNKFIFPYSDDGVSIFDLYESDGTGPGTVVFKSFPPNTNSNIPIIYTNLNFDQMTKTLTYPLFNGKFYFAADDVTHGNELWMSDGTPGGTSMLEDINPGPADGIVDNFSYMFTTTNLFFAASDGVHGNELWKTNGSVPGTAMVQDIFPVDHNANPSLTFLNNSKIFFTAWDSNPADSSVSDLYVVDGNFSPLPVHLLDFTVTTKGADAILQWSTAQEFNSLSFIVQSSDDAQHWNQIGTIAAAGNSSLQKNYSFIDAGVMKSGKGVVYYRLIQTDLDGRTTNSNIILLKIESNAHWNVQLYNNPVRGNNLRLILSGVKGIASLSVNDLNGRVIYRKQIQNQNGLMNIPAYMPAGVYILRVETSDGSKSIKFVKE